MSDRPPRDPRDASAARRALLQRRLAERHGEAAGPTRLPRGAYPLRLPSSAGQERLWILDQLSPGLTAYNETITIRLRGPLDLALLRGALDAVAARHETLRTSLAEEAGGVVQIVDAPRPVPLATVDLANADEDPSAAFEAACVREVARPFDLAHGPLVRATLYRFWDQEHVLSLVLHHAVVDGWSAGVFLRDLAAAYEALGLGLPPPGELPLQYADFAAWQRGRIAGPLREALVDQWRSRIGAAPLRLELPGDRPRPPVQAFEAGRVARHLPTSLALGVVACCRRYGLTPFIVLLTAVQVLLHRLSGQERLVVGVPSSGRLRPDLEHLVGFFLNNLVFPADLAGEPSLEELLARNREHAAFALTAQELPFEALVEALRPPRDPSRTPVFQVLVNFLNIDNEPRTAGRVFFEPMARPTVDAKFDLTVYGAEEADGLRLELVYARALFDEARVEAMAESLESVLVGILTAPAQRASALALAGARSHAVHPRELPAAREDLPRLDAAFDTAARAEPSRPALRAERATQTYAALDDRAGRVAAALLARGVGPGDLVALCVPRSPDLVAALVGVLRAGAAFLVLDPAHPVRRHTDVIGRARPRLVAGEREALERLAAAETADVVAPGRLDLGALLDGADAAADDTGGRTAAAGNASHIAYAAVTSGTTGRPQIVLGAHAPVAQFLGWQRETFGLGAGDRFALLSGLGHDPLLRDVFAPLSIGATLSIPAEAALRDPDALFEWLSTEAVSVVHATPGLLRLLLTAAGAGERGLPALRLVFTGGDALRWRDVRAIRAVAPNARVVNLYGTTETPQGVAFFDTSAEKAGADEELVPVGRGREGVHLLVLDAQDRLAAIGELGEVCVRSPYLTEGYVGEPELTRQRFVASPSGGPGDRAYRTGDLGRYRPDGAVALAGRADRQLKLRGYRLDPAEVEARIASHPGVREAAIVSTGDDESARLVAFVVGDGGPPPAAPELRAWLLARLPEPFVPAEVVAIDRLPLTPNGKLDTRRLPMPSSRVEPRSGEAPAPIGDPVAERLADLWQRFIGVRPSALDDDFFALGGHSLAAARLAAAVRREMGRNVPLAAIVTAPTLRAMTRVLAGEPEAFSAVVRFRESGLRTPIFLMHPHSGTVFGYRPLVAHLAADRPVYGLQSRALDPAEPIPTTLEALAARHVDDVLRMVGEGPCHLAGHSLGGAIAFEMAIQIAARGGRVGLVALFDTWRPDLERLKPPMPVRVAKRLRNLVGLRGSERREYVRSWLTGVAERRGLRPRPRTEEALGPMLMAVRQVNSRAAGAYVRRPYAGRVTLFRALVRPTDRYDWPDLGWAGLCPNGLEIVRVTGDHESLVTEPHVEALARRIEERLD